MYPRLGTLSPLVYFQLIDSTNQGFCEVRADQYHLRRQFQFPIDATNQGFYELRADQSLFISACCISLRLFQFTIDATNWQGFYREIVQDPRGIFTGRVVPCLSPRSAKRAMPLI